MSIVHIDAHRQIAPGTMQRRSEGRKQLISYRVIDGVSVAATTTGLAIAAISAAIETRAPLVVAFCNAHTANVCVDHPPLRAALAAALVLNDGVGVNLASRLVYGAPFPENLNGTDFTPALLAGAPRILRIALIGSAPGVARQAMERLATLHPRHTMIGAWDGYYEPRDRAARMRDIAGRSPDLVLVGMGQPRQEIWARDYVATHGGTAICIGAYLDFVAGVVPRAPHMVRTLRLEWLFRLALEPRRLGRRYLIGNGRFLARACAEAVRARRAR